jgi:hypothetical protein
MRPTILRLVSLRFVNYSISLIATNYSALIAVQVHLEGVPVDGDYWILELGPDTYGSEKYYQYAIVSDSKGASLFVLARDVEEYKTVYDADVLTSLTELGFTKVLDRNVDIYLRLNAARQSYNSPVEVPQEGCTYTADPYTSGIRLHKTRRSPSFASFLDLDPATVDELVVEQYLGR